jgi:hypothetical protein
MTDISEFIARAHAYCSARNVSRSTLSRKLLGNGMRLGELEAGKSLRMDTFERATDMLKRLESVPAPITSPSSDRKAA